MMREPYGFGNFKLKDIFTFRAGGRVRKQDQQDGDIPYVTAVTTNNGIESYISNPKFTEENILTVNFFGNVYYHPYKVSYKDGTYGLTPIRELTKNHMLYLTSSIQKQTLQMGDYNNAIRVKDLEILEIELPIKQDGSIDWDHMEDYIHNIKRLYIDKLEDYINNERLTN